MCVSDIAIHTKGTVIWFDIDGEERGRHAKYDRRSLEMVVLSVVVDVPRADRRDFFTLYE